MYPVIVIIKKNTISGRNNQKGLHEDEFVCIFLIFQLSKVYGFYYLYFLI